MHLHGNYENNIAEAYNLINSGKIDSAIDLFENLTAMYPKTSKGFHMKAYAYIKNNNFNKALESIKQAKSLNPESLDISLDYSNILNTLGNKEEAIKTLSQFDKEDITDTRVYYNLGCMLMDDNENKKALEYFKKTLKLDPKNKQAAYNVGVTLFNSGDYKKAIEVFIAYQKEFDMNFEAERYISLSHFSMNNLNEADSSLQKLCVLKPEDASLWFDRGIILSGLRRNYDAIHCYQKTLELTPDFNDAFWNMAMLYQKEGKLLELIEVYENYQHDSKYNHIFFSFLSQAYHLAGNPKKAINLIDKAIENHPLRKENDKHYLNYFLIKGNILNSSENYVEAIKIYKDVLKVDDKIEQAYVNIGSALINSKKMQDAIPYLKKAIEINPRFAASYVNLGNAYYSIGDKAKALEAFNKAEEIDSGVSAALSSKAAAYMDTGKKDKAVMALIKAIEKDPYNGNAYINLGAFFREQGQSEEAAKWLKRAISIFKSQPYKDKQIAKAFTNLGYSYLDLEKYNDMKECFVNAIKYNENHLAVAGFYCYSKLFVADWNDIDKYKNLTLSKVEEGKNVCTPFCSFSVTDDPKIQYEIAKTYSKDRLKQIHIENKYSHERNKKHKKPRIAYISGDFHDHATLHLMAGVFEKQNNKEFDYYAFSYSNKSDGNLISKRVKGSFKNFYDVKNYSNEQIADSINKLEIDIAVDLKGYTYGTRIDLFAHRPAPIQISYLGHPGTTGTNFIDYILLDNYVVTNQNKSFFTENIINLKGCYQSTDDKRLIPSESPRKKYGLPEDKFIFCSFNNTYKIQPEVFNIWMEILNEKKDSVLWLLDANNQAKENLILRAKNKGVNKDRIIFSERVLNSDHIQRQMCADLFLDTFPICAHTTASDALWVGLPLITISGKSMVSRVAGSILKNIGMEKLITSNYEEYKSKALYYANNKNALESVKKEIVGNRFKTPLFNTEAFVEDLESNYRKLFNNFKNS